MIKLNIEKLKRLVKFKKWEDTVVGTPLPKRINGKANINDNVYKKIKPALEEFNHNRCMYCQCDISAGASYDVEHYRPKNEYQNDLQLGPHPGYYWLAYQWDNLLLSCQHCNRSNKNEDAELGIKRTGKWRQFPTKKEPITDENLITFEQLENEEPFLLHPYFDEPELHIEPISSGMLKGKSDRGKKTIEVLNLNRKQLVRKREFFFSCLMQRVAAAQSLIEKGINSKSGEESDFEIIEGEVKFNPKMEYFFYNHRYFTKNR